MAHSLRPSPFPRTWRSPAQSSGGFTLIELLVAILVAGGIISGLLYLAVELLRTDSREYTRAETQRDLQFAMDFMSNELKEAVYVYPDTTNPDPDVTPISNLVGAALPPESVPVIAFWKQQVLPDAVLERCATDLTFNAAPCLTGHSYSLVVYSLARPAADDVWQGQAQIIRSAMVQFDSDGDSNDDEGYVSPVQGTSLNFTDWPFTQATGFQQNDVLSDFIDDGTGSDAAALTRSGLCPVDPGAAPGDPPTYSISPSEPLDGTVRSFYACVSQPGVNISPESWSQEVIIHLQGNAVGRSGLYDEGGFLPALESRVLSRGILNKNPAD